MQLVEAKYRTKKLLTSNDFGEKHQFVDTNTLVSIFLPRSRFWSSRCWKHLSFLWGFNEDTTSVAAVTTDDSNKETVTRRSCEGVAAAV